MTYTESDKKTILEIAITFVSTVLRFIFWKRS